MTTSPAERIGTPVDGVDVLGALSPSRAGDFMTCPLLYRFRTIDRLPEPPSLEAVRGTLVHKVLEDLFDLPALRRTPEQAHALLEPTWEALVASEPTLDEMFAEAGRDVVEWLTSCRTALDQYFTLEDPRRLEPAERELYVEALLDSRLLLRGFVDRLDVAPDGALRVVDYKGLAIDTPLPTPTGWTTMGDVSVGDTLLGSDGRATTVTLKSGVHHRPCYRVVFADGSTVVCDNVHLWTIVESRRQHQRVRTVDTDALASLHRARTLEGQRQSLWVESAAALDLPDNDSDLVVSPWLLGAWLGDGKTSVGEICAGRDDAADMVTLVKEHWPLDVSVRSEKTCIVITPTRRRDQCTFGHSDFKDPTSGHPTRRCAHESTHSSLQQSNVSLGGLLTRLGVRGGKHIPRAYLRAGREQRIELLRGLMDTDGWWNRSRRRAGFTTTDDQLADDVVELLRTLGLHPQHFSKPYQNPTRPGRTWHVIEFTPVGFNPFALPRKATACEGSVTPLQTTLAKRRVITAVEPVESVPTQCVAVDAADSLYLCGTGFVPTHNTGKSPTEMWEGKALFQMKFYALVIWRTRGVVPKLLQLIYLGNAEIVRYVPDEADLLATERKVVAVWEAIRRAQESRDWRPSPGRLCDWCAHKALCPAWGGTPPPLPEDVPAESSGELTADDVD